MIFSDEQVDEKLLYDTFSAFGVITGNTPKCMRDPETGASKVKWHHIFSCIAEVV